VGALGALAGDAGRHALGLERGRQKKRHGKKEQ
jgi:hypothetical protein